MKDDVEDVRFPNGNPTPFQVAAIQRLSSLLRDRAVTFDEFRFNKGAFWTDFELNGKEHTLAVFSDYLNITAGPNLYESYLRREFESKDVLLESFARRLTRLLEEGIWELPEESRPSFFSRAFENLFRRRK